MTGFCLRLSIFGVVAALVIGCNRQNGSEKELQKTENGRSAQKIVQQVRQLNESRLQTLVKERNGKILFVNVWATWCAPCIEEFPDIVKLAESYEGKNVEFIGISVDFPDEADSKILPFMVKQGVPFDVYVAGFEKQEMFINALNESWSGAIPATFIYDASGKQRSILVGKQTLEQFKEEIEKVRGSS